MALEKATRIRCEKVIGMTFLAESDGNLLERHEILCVTIVHISVAMRHIFISTLDDHVCGGNWSFGGGAVL